MSKIETREWTYVDKSEWQHGPWVTEPDKLQWQDEATGLACLIVRGPSGALCGYAGVPESHPWFGKGYSDRVPLTDAVRNREVDPTRTPVIEMLCAGDIEKDGVRIALHCDVHGGLTFSGGCSPHADNPERGICHVVAGDDRVWWFGFDCAHLGDVTPSRSDDFRDIGSSYRDLGYVKREVAGLARQLAEVIR